MKVQIGRNSTGKKYPHHLQHDVSTSSAVGFCQPILAREMNAQDTAKLRIAEIVRLMPMVLPTFGNIKLKTYTSFVKTEDIFHAFGSLLSGQSYHGNGESYIPEQLPYASPSVFNYVLWLLSDVYIYEVKSLTNLDGVSHVSLADTNYRQVNIPRDWDSDPMKDAFYLDYNLFFNLGSAIDYEDQLLNFNTACFHEFGQVCSYGLRNTLSHALDPDYFDQVIVWDHNPFRSEGYSYIVMGCKYSTPARNLRKILLGLRYGISFDNDNIEIVRLVAYYKAYFDLFYPNREKTWKNTAAFHLMEKAEQSGQPNVFNPADNWSDLAISEFFLNLAGAYYTINPDYASAHIVGTAGTLGNNQVSFPYLTAENELTNVGSDDISKLPSEVYAGNTVDRPMLRVLDELTKLYNKQTAIGGDIGAFLREEFNMDYTDECESQLLGTSILDLSPEPVINQAETPQGALGEFAGACVGSTSGKDGSIHFTAKTHGYLISFFAIVPDGKLAQGVDPCIYHTKRFDFFDQKFDAITLLPTRKSAIYGNLEIADEISGDFDYGEGFGNIPNYSEYAVISNVVNGELSQRSKRAKYMAFTLDKLLPYSFSSVDSSNVWNFGALPASELVAGTKWRYIGKVDWLGNFNRIFLNSGTPTSPFGDVLPSIDDNYIVQMYLDFHVTSYKLPLSLSFDTDGFGDSLSVEKA